MLQFARTMARYNAWMNERLYDCCARPTDTAISGWVASLSEEDLRGTLSYISIVNPTERTYPMGFAIAHFLNHQTHHRGQLTTLLYQAGIDPGVTDLIWLPAEPQAP